MPNGYTSDIYDGNESFRNYAMNVAKAFGAYYHLRDESSDAPLSKLDSDSLHFYQKKLDDAQVAYDDFTALSLSEQKELWQEELVKIRKVNAESKVRNEELAARYSRMLGKVVAWNVPKELAGLKSTMRQYLIESMDFDCGTGPVYQMPEPTLDKWIDDKVRGLQRDIIYYTNSIEREKKRLAEQHAFHEALMDALKDMD